MDSSPSSSSRQVYRIDEHDRLCEVDCGWMDVAGAIPPTQVLGRSLWEFVRDPTVIAVYRQMIRQARAGRVLRFRYRCDAPEWRRLYEMTIQSCGSSRVEFASQLVREEARKPVTLLDRSLGPRSRELVRICSWCERAALPGGGWLPIEEAVEALGVMQHDTMPQLTHGICERCFARVKRSFELGGDRFDPGAGG